MSANQKDAGVSDRQVELIKDLLEHDDSAVNSFPLSFTQQRLWFLDELEPGLPIYNIPAAIRLTGALDIDALTSSLNEVVRRHEVLRTIFISIDGRPKQVILPALTLSIPVLELGELGATEQEKSVCEMRDAEARRPFSLSHGPLLRATLIQLDQQHHLLLLTVHHIVSDGWSTGLLVRELTSLYESFTQGTTSSLPQLEIQYADFAVWQREWAETEEHREQLEYWSQKLQDAAHVLELPTDHTRPAIRSFRGATQSVLLDSDLTQKLKELSQSEGVTLFMTLLAAFQILLYRYTRRNDILVGTPIANRNPVETEQLIGFFANTLVLRTVLSDSPFREILARVRETCLEAYAHQELPFEKLVEVLHPERSLSSAPLFQVMFVLRNAPQAPLKLPNLTLQLMEAHSATAKFDLTLSMVEVGQELQGSFEYSMDLFEGATIGRLAQHFETLLESIVATPEERISELALLTTAEREQLLIGWNETQCEYEDGQCLHERFEAQVAKTPAALAVICEGEQLSYRELNRRANQLAHYLARQGVGPETLVGICMERSLEQLVAVLGVLKAGGGYFPLEPTFPPPRLSFLLSDAQAPVLLTQQRLLARLPEYGGTVVSLDSEWAAIAQESAENFESGVTAANVAYVIYTSGSSGKPKGVVVEQRQILNYIQAISERLGFAGEASYAMVQPLTVDAAQTVLFPPLCAGGTVHVIGQERATDAAAMAAYFREHEIDCLKIAPSHLEALQQAGEGERLLPRRWLVLGGESPRRDWIEQMRQTAPECQIVNHYGPTETTVAMLTHGMDGASAALAGVMPLGRPLANTRAYVLERELQPAPLGVVGELFIGGECVTRGYLGQPAKTAEQFIPDPFGAEPGGRLYRTGDLVRYAADGKLIFMGRRDEQLKVRGYRVEPGEIEAALVEHEAVRECVAMLREDVAGDPRLVAYYVCAAEVQPSVSELRSFLAERLPAPLLPSAYVLLASLPLTGHGKVDRNQLPAPEQTRAATAEYTAPRTKVELQLAAIWQEVLGAERVAVDDNFFDLGGHSLLATQVISRVRDRFKIEMPLRNLFEAPTIGQLAARVAASQATVKLEGPRVVERLANGMPLSFAQQRMWFMQQLEPESSAYHIPGAVRLRGPLAVRELEQSLNKIIERHESLRTVFPSTAGQPLQQVLERVEWRLNELDLTQERGLSAILRSEIRMAFDLSSGPLFRVVLARVADDEHVLLVVLHHIIADGWSMEVLLRELVSLYESRVRGERSNLPDLGVQYVDYAKWQRDWLSGEVLDQQVRYWKDQLADAPPVLELPIDAPRLARTSLRGSTLPFTFEESLTERLRKISRENETTLFMTLLAAFKVLLYRHTGQSDIVVGTPIANRTRAEIEPLIGFFVNTLVLRTELNGNPSFEELLKRVREVCLGAYAHQDMPFEKLVELLQPDRELTHAPLFQVTFALQNAPRELSESSTLEWTIREIETGTAKFDLSLQLVETEDGLRGSLQYNVELFSRETIERMVRHYEAVLRVVAESIEQRIGEIPLLDEGERQQVLEGWNWTERSYDRTKTVVELFDEQVQLHAESVAVSCEGEEITYGELNRRANQVAHYLQQQGVGPEVLVGVCLERSVEMVVGLLGTVKAGGAYLPLDPGYPQERLGFMLDDADVRVLLTSEQFSSTLPPTNALVVPLDSAWQQSIAPLPDHNPVHHLDASNLAYVIYTSGSTGKPKAVLVQHESLLNLVLWHQDRFNVTAADRATQLASLAFDAAVWELWPYLTSGGSVCLLRDAASLTAEELRDWLIAQSVTMSFLPTPLAERVLNVDWPERIPLRALLTGGDRLRTNKDASLSFALVNNYGPTECTVLATSAEVQSTDHSSEPSIGRPIANTNVYVVNEWLEPAPVGMMGELLIGGAGVARGYHDQPQMTAEHFTPDPFTNHEGSRLYRTGDVVRWKSDGELEFVGRKDGQVKVRGYRIELAEVEAAIKQHDSIGESVVAVREGERGEGRLVGYVAPVSGKTVTLNELREYLAGKLPHYMIPTAFVILGELPLTANGKIDHKALPAPDATQLGSGREYVEPGDPTEQIVANIWAEVLGLKRVGANDNFFELGGHSLLATQVISRVRESFKIELPLRSLFESPEVRALAEKIAASKSEPGAELKGPRRVERRAEGMPLSFAQQRLWFMEQWAETENATYHIPTAMRLSGDLDVPALEQSLQELVRRHESLRTRFIVETGEVRQQISGEWPVTLTVEELDAESIEARDGMIQRRLEGEIRKPFDLTQVPLLRVRLLRVAPSEHVLLLVVHHIIADGWSMSVLVRELVSLYESKRSGDQSELPSLEVQYVDYAQWQREWLSGEVSAEQERYWKQQLADAPPILELPTDRVRPTVQTFSGGRETLKLSAALSERLKVVSRQTDVTPFMVLLAAFEILLSRHSGQEDIVVGTPVAGRNHRLLEPLIGIFLNTLVLRTDLSGNPTFRDVLARVREVCLGAYAHQEMPFEKLLETLQPVRVLSHTPLVQVYFNMLNLPDSRIELPGLVVENMALPEGGSKFDLTLYLKEQADGIQLTLVYNTDLFDATRMSMFLAQYEYLLDQVLENIDEHIELFSLVAPAALEILPDPARNLQSHWSGAIHETFAAQAISNPEDTAVLDGGDAWSYRALNERSNQLAHYFLARGIPRQGVIVVLGHRSAALIWGLLGILKAGAAFTILDPSYPDARLLDYLSAVEPRGFLELQAAGNLSPRVQEYIDSLPLHCHLLVRQPGSVNESSTETDEVLRDFPVSNPSVAIDRADLAYIAFTSGSTGKPKGILGRHQSLSLFGRWARETFGIGESDRFSMLSGLAHDPLHRDILTPLQLGATICVPDPEGIGRPGWLAQWFNSERITVANLTPAMGQLLCETLTPGEQLTSLRHVFYIGDVLTRLAVSSLRRIAPEVNCVNLYGATETQRAVSFFITQPNDVESDTNGAEKDILPVGRGIKEVQLLVLNNAGGLAGVGEIGEVCFRSPHLSGGYLGDEILTREKFVINPITNLPHDRLYRSGDLGRYQPDGNVALVGRRDGQVKIRGYRVELSEIEGVLGAHLGVKDCAVLAHEYAPGDKRLVAYVVLHDEGSMSTSELRHFLGRRLPQYMIPSQYVFLSALPLTPNGKLNRKALLAPERSLENERGYIAPRTPIEEKLATIWENLLGVAKVGIHDNFFERGGHSLLATRMISHLRDVTNVELSLRFLFESPTIAEIALFVVQHQAAQKEDEELERLLAGLEQLSEHDLQTYV